VSWTFLGFSGIAAFNVCGLVMIKAAFPPLFFL